MNKYNEPTIKLILDLLAEAAAVNDILNITLENTVNQLGKKLIADLQQFEKNGKIDLQQKIDLSNHPDILFLIKQLENSIIEALNEYAWVAMSASGESLTQSYVKTVKTTQEILGISKANNPNLNILTNKDYVKSTILKIPWCQDGKTYSERIYANVANFEAKLAFVLEEGITKGRGIDWMMNSWKKLTGSAAYDTARLLQTETMAMWSLATKKSYLDAGIKYVIISNTDPCSEVCGEYNNNQPIPLHEATLGDKLPPYHPFCRCYYYAYDGPAPDDIY